MEPLQETAFPADPATLFTPLGPFEPEPTIALALSGGADSMALALLAQQWLIPLGGRLVALTVDHALRPESRREAEQVGAWMAAHGITHHILTPPHTPAGNNLMQAARQWRYHALSEWCRTHDVLHCLVAHHADDQLETAIIQQQRGDTADGTAGMSALRLYRGVRFLRPLLPYRKALLRDYLVARQVSWVDDPTNSDSRYARTQVRQQLHPTEAAGGLGLLAAQALARQQREADGARTAMQLVQLHPAGYAQLQHAAWLALVEPLRQQILADVITTVGGHIHRPRHHETAWLAQAMAAKKGTQTLGRCLISWANGLATIAREPARVEPPITLSGEGVVLWDQRFRVHYRLHQPLTLGALGSHGASLLGRKDVPHATPALWHLDALHAVPHIMPYPESSTIGEVRLGFAPAKPLAARSFWWLNSSILLKRTQPSAANF